MMYRVLSVLHALLAGCSSCNGLSVWA